MSILRRIESRVPVEGLLIGLPGGLGILGAIASIKGEWGYYGASGAIAVTVVIVVLSLLALGPVLSRNQRGIPLYKAIKRVGLVDIEDRNCTDYGVPPSLFYKQAKYEVAAICVGGWPLFMSKALAIQKLLERPVDVCVAVLDPGRLDLVEPADALIIKSEIDLVLQAVRENGFHNQRRFQVRFLQNLPSFTGLLLDGDIQRRGNPGDAKGQVRVEPYGQSRTSQMGVVLQFREVPDQERQPFNFYAENFRDMWANAKKHPELLAEAVTVPQLP